MAYKLDKSRKKYKFYYELVFFELLYRLWIFWIYKGEEKGRKKKWMSYNITFSLLSFFSCACVCTVKIQTQSKIEDIITIIVAKIVGDDYLPMKLEWLTWKPQGRRGRQIEALKS